MIKKFLTIELIKNSLSLWSSPQDIFRADVIIFLDSMSSEVYNLILKGANEEQIMTYVNSDKKQLNIT